ncbi:MAG: hypothetical protein PUC65_00165 [Clostridiales bacterium]|nr:hypothetical protein [Clostridiales bacterium]
MKFHLEGTKKHNKKTGINKMILGTGCILITILVTGILIRKQILRLKDPVFLRNCSEVYIMDNENSNSFHQYLTIQYITNSDDQRKICNIEFTDMPQLRCSLTTSPYILANSHFYTDNVDPILGDYQLHSIQLQFHLKNYEPLDYEVKLPTATINYDDGTKQNVDLGTIVLVPWARRENIELFEWLKSWGKKRDQEMEYYCTLPNDFSLQRIDSILGDAVYDNVSFHFGHYRDIPWNQPLNDQITMDFDQTLSIEVNFNNSDYDYYCLRPEITAKYHDKEETSLIDTAEFHIPLNNYRQILNYLKKRGAIHG